MLRTVGQWMSKIRRMASEFQGQFQEAMREAEMADLKKQVDEIDAIRPRLQSAFDPLEDADVEKLIGDRVQAADRRRGRAATATPATPHADRISRRDRADAAPPRRHSVPMPDLPPPPETQTSPAARRLRRSTAPAPSRA